VHVGVAVELGLSLVAHLLHGHDFVRWQAGEQGLVLPRPVARAFALAQGRQSRPRPHQVGGGVGVVERQAEGAAPIPQLHAASLRLVHQRQRGGHPAVHVICKRRGNESEHFKRESKGPYLRLDER